MRNNCPVPDACINSRAWLTSHDFHTPSSHQMLSHTSGILNPHAALILIEDLLLTMSRILCVGRKPLTSIRRPPKISDIYNISSSNFNIARSSYESRRRHASNSPWRVDKATSPAGAITVTDSSIFGNIFATKETKAVWSDRQRTAYFLEFEAALAKVQAHLGIIPAEAYFEIAKNCDVDDYDFEKLREETELVGYPVLPVVHQLVAKVNAVEVRERKTQYSLAVQAQNW